MNTCIGQIGSYSQGVNFFLDGNHKFYVLAVDEICCENKSCIQQWTVLKDFFSRVKYFKRNFN